MKLRLLMFLMIFPVYGVFAQPISGDNGSCAPPDGGLCGVCDTDTQEAFLELAGNPTDDGPAVSLTDTDGTPLMTVADVLYRLPLALRGSFLFMSDSRSFQRSDFENPRVLMKSQNSDVILSFNGHRDIGGESFLGEERLEAMIWNGAEARFEFIDIECPSENGVSPQSVPCRSERNPQKCLSCHSPSGNMADARPNWDPYNFWQGQLPFNRDTLAPGTIESEHYLNLIRQTEGGDSLAANWTGGNPELDREFPELQPNPRLEALTFQQDSRQLATRLFNANGGNGSYEIRDRNVDVPGWDDFDGPGVRMFDQLTPRNFCRIGARLKERDDIQDLAPALQGAYRQCSNFEDFFPDGAAAINSRFFESRGYGVDNEGNFSLDRLENETSELQQGVFDDKRSRQLWTIQRDIMERNPELSETEAEVRAKQEMDTIVSRGFGSLDNLESSRNAPIMARFRYLLEPIGVDVDSWSMSIDASTYSFADLMSRIRRYLPEIENFEGNAGNCDELAAESLRRLSESEPYKTNLTNFGCNDSFVSLPLGDASDAIEELSVEILRPQAQEVFDSHSCAGCHTRYEMDNGVEISGNGAPEIPFGNLEELETRIQATQGSPNGGWAQQIYNRINRREGARGQMPLGMPTLSLQERETIRNYFNAVRQQGANNDQ